MIIAKVKQMLNILKALTSTNLHSNLSHAHIERCTHHMDPCHIKHQHQETANYSEHGFANCYWLHTIYKHSTPT